VIAAAQLLGIRPQFVAAGDQVFVADYAGQALEQIRRGRAVFHLRGVFHDASLC